MKTIILTLSVYAIIISGFVTISHATIKYTGVGNNMDVDIRSFPPNMQAIYPLYRQKCSNTKCHGIDRSIITIVNGLTPNSTLFDHRAIDAYGYKMLRKPDSNMNKQETKKILELLHFMIDQ